MRASWQSIWRSTGCLALENLIKPPSSFIRPFSYSSGLSAARLSADSPLLRSLRNDISWQHARGLTSTASAQAKSIPTIRKRRISPVPPSPHGMPTIDQGVPLPKHRSLSRRDLYLIFPRSGEIDERQGLRILQVLQGRRQHGTLDLPLPPDVARLVAGDTRLVVDGLKFLRHEYQLDEDAAILRRIQEEEAAQAERQRLQNEQQLRPQSGKFGEERGSNNSIWGISALEQLRAQHQMNAKLIEEEDTRMIDQLDQSLKAEGKSGGLIKLEEQDLSVGRPISVEDIKNNVYLRWKFKHSMAAMSHITAAQAASMNMFRRLVPSAVFTILFTLGMYWFSTTWYEPNQLDRMYPSVPLSVATLAGIMAVNVAIFGLWRMWPPAWKWLNRYFISVHSWPYAFSMLGNTFSHQSAKHLLMNMLVLWMIGPRLHEDVGRGDFLAIYLSSGVIASLGSMTFSVLRGAFATTSLGASGCITGILGAYYTTHSSDLMTVPFLPADLQRSVAVTGSTLLGILMTTDIIGIWLLSRFGRNVDSVAHLCGYTVGIISSLWLKHGKDGTTSKEGTTKSWFAQITGSDRKR